MPSATESTIVSTLRAVGWKRSASLPLILDGFKLTKDEAASAAEFLKLDARLLADLEEFRERFSNGQQRAMHDRAARTPEDHDHRASYFGLLHDTPSPEGFAKAKAAVREGRATNVRNAAPWIRSAGARASERIKKLVLDGWHDDEERNKAIGCPVEASAATAATAQALGVLEARIEAATHPVAPSVDAARDLAKLFGAE